jgi:hypothetical protein
VGGGGELKGEGVEINKDWTNLRTRFSYSPHENFSIISRMMEQNKPPGVLCIVW